MLTPSGPIRRSRSRHRHRLARSALVDAGGGSNRRGEAAWALVTPTRSCAQPQSLFRMNRKIERMSTVCVRPSTHLRVQPPRPLYRSNGRGTPEDPKDSLLPAQETRADSGGGGASTPACCMRACGHAQLRAGTVRRFDAATGRGVVQEVPPRRRQETEPAEGDGLGSAGVIRQLAARGLSSKGSAAELTARLQLDDEQRTATAR